MTFKLISYITIVGEPLNTEAWEWYHKVVGGGKCTVVDTWWQTGEHPSNTRYTDQLP